jgi:predicted amidohydrolase
VRPQPPAAGEGLRLGIWQGSGSAGTPEALEENLARLERVCELAAGHGVQLLAFPELYLTGYIVTPSIVRQRAEPVEGPSLRRVAAAARRHGLAVACPNAERATVAGEERFYDAIALFDKGGRLLRNYRKTHLWGPDEKRCWSAGYRHPEEGAAFTVQPVNGVVDLSTGTASWTVGTGGSRFECGLDAFAAPAAQVVVTAGGTSRTLELVPIPGPAAGR